MKTYYLSNQGCDGQDGLSPETAWATIAKVNDAIAPGDTVLLRRGDTFYGRVNPPKHDDPAHPTTFAAYGDGPKPVLSQYKIPLAGAWEKVGEGVWRLDLSDTTRFTGNVTEPDTNVGFLKVNGQICGRNTFGEPMQDLWEYWCDKPWLYVRADEDPSGFAVQIACNIGCMRFADCLRVENIVMNGTGGHGISGVVHHAAVVGCEFHEIGGSILPGYPRANTRYGNGVECWSNSSDVLVEDCRFSQIYDVAITMQGNEVKTGWERMTFRRNVMTNCQQCFEIWSSGDLPDTGFIDCLYEENVCVDSGFGWSYDVRPDKASSCHLLLYGLECPLCGITVRNNTFIHSRLEPVFKSGGPAGIPADYRITGNTFIIFPGQEYGFRHTGTAEDCAAFRERILAENRVIEEGFTTAGKT